VAFTGSINSNIQKKYAYYPKKTVFYCTFAPIKKRKYNKDVIKNNKMPYLTTEKKAGIFATYGAKATNTGSIEGQIALLTERINHISLHLKENKKDFSSQRGLMKMVGQRKRLLTYLSKHDLTGYRGLIEKLGLRK
jgi:small subunit ribosomal protein S15